jgi:hypothetical protein
MKKEDISDCKLSPAAFCKKFLGLTLTPQQKIIINSKNRYVVKIAARMIGRTILKRCFKQWEKFFKKSQ